MRDRTEPALNGDMTKRVVVDTARMEWLPSPSGSVLRKRLHRVGPAESGQVTSLVRYQPGASFPEHPHPEGEEIFVLSGTFSDQSGDARAGTHLLNPEGFHHAPFSEPGCLIFVKLRQYAGDDRSHRRTDTSAMEWEGSELEGIERKILYQEPRFPETMRVERWRAGAAPGPRKFDGGAEILVVEGTLEEESHAYGEGTWLRLPPGDELDARSASGCVLYVKADGLGALHSADG